MLIDLAAALTAKKVGFRLAWKRARHIRHGHPFNRSQRLDKMQSEAHPHSSADYVYTVNVMRCEECGLTYLDAGLESRTR